MDVHRTLLVTGIPEGLEPAAIEAVLQPAFRPVGTFRLRSTRAVRGGKARAALVELLEDVDPSAIPSEIPGRGGAWRVLCKGRAEDSRVLRQMKRWLLDERAPGDTPITAPAAEAAEAQGPARAPREAGPPPPGAASKARTGRRSRRSRARGHRLTQKGKKRGRGGRPFPCARRGSEDSSPDSLGIVVEELDEEALGGLDAQRALYTTLQVAARELVGKWALQGDPEGAGGPREFLALVTVTDKAKKEELEKETPGAESISLNIEDLSGVPDLVALLAVRDTWDEEPVGSGASGSESSQDSGDPGPEGGHPEFVAIVAYTDPADPSAREEMLKIASVIESLGWSCRREQGGALPEVLSVMAKDTRGARVQVQEAGRQVDALVLRKATDDGNLLQCISTLAEPGPLPRGQPAPRRHRRRLLGAWGGDGEGEVGLLELVALLAAQDMAEGMKAGKEGAWEGGKHKYHKGGLGELLALLAAREDRAPSEQESEGTSEGGSGETSEDAESEESEREDRASEKPRAKRVRTASKGLGPAGAPSGSRKTRRGGRGGRGNPPEKKAKEEAAGDKKKKKGRAGARAKAGEARGQPSPGSQPARGHKARRGGRLAPKGR